MSLILIISISFLSGCNLNKNNSDLNKKSNSSISVLNMSEQKKLNHKLAVNFGLKDVDSIKIHYMGYTNGYGDQDKMDNRPVSKYAIFEKNIDSKNVNIINQTLESLIESRKEINDDPFSDLKSINLELDKIKKGELSPKIIKIREKEGYSVYPDMKVVVPEKFNPYISLESSNGKVVEIPFLMDSLGTYIQSDNKKYQLSSYADDFFNTALEQSKVNADIPEDISQIASKNNLVPSLVETGEITLPKIFKEDVYGDGFNLFWENINDILKTSSSTGDQLENYRGKNVKVEKYYIRKGKIEGVERKDGLYVPKKDSSVSASFWMIALRNSNGKLIGEFLTSSKSPFIPNARMDGKTLYQITGETDKKWLNNAYIENNSLKSISKLSPEELIMQYYSMLNRGDNNAKHLFVPVISSINGKIFKDDGSGLNENDYISNIKKAKLLKVSKSKNENLDSNSDDEVFEVEVDFKYKKVIVSPDGIDIFYVTLVNMDKNLGYRISSIGY